MNLTNLIEFWNKHWADHEGFEPVSTDVDSKEELVAWLDEKGAAYEQAHLDVFAESLISTDNFELPPTIQIMGGLAGLQETQADWDPEDAGLKLGFLVLGGGAEAIGFDLVTGRLISGDVACFECFADIEEDEVEEGTVTRETVLKDIMAEVEDAGEFGHTWDSMADYVAWAKDYIENFDD